MTFDHHLKTCKHCRTKPDLCEEGLYLKLQENFKARRQTRKPTNGFKGMDGGEKICAFVGQGTSLVGINKRLNKP